MSKVLVSLVSTVASLCVGAGTFVWNPSARLSTYGAASVRYADGSDAVTDVYVAAQAGEDGHVEFTGDDAFAFAPDAKVRLVGASLALRTPVTDGGFSLAIDSSQLETFCSTETFDDWLHSKASQNWQLLFPGKKVADYEFDSAYLDSGALSKKTVNVPWFVQRTDTSLSAEFQYQDGSVAKGVRMTLVDSDEGIRGYVDYARYAYVSPVYTFSFDDLDQVKAKSGGNIAIARRADDASGYGVRSVTIRPRMEEGRTMTVSNAVYTAESASVGTGTELVLDSLAEGSSVQNLSLARGGVLRFRNMETVAPTGTFAADAGQLIFEQDTPENPVEERETFFDKKLSSSSAQFLLENVRVSDITSWNVPYLTGSITNPETKQAKMCFVVRTEDCIQFQLQLDDDSWTKACVMEIFQSGNQVLVRKLYSAYWSASDGKAGTVDMIQQEASFFKGKWDSNENYCPVSLTVSYTIDTSLATTEAQVSFGSATRQCVLKNAQIGDIWFVTADHLVGNMSDTKSPPFCCFVRRTDTEIDFQLQITDSGTLKASRYILYQNGSDVWGYKVMSWWDTGNPAPRTIDFANPPEGYTPTGSSDGASYYPQSLLFTARKLPHMNARIAGMNTTTAKGLAVTVGTNVTLTVDSATTTLPAGGTVEVGGTLSVTASGAIGTSPITVKAGGVLSISGGNAIALGTPQDIIFDGGRLLAADGLSYCNRPIFRNGGWAACGTASGELRVGAQSMSWRVEGSSASGSDAPIRCVSGGTGAGEFTMTWNVADVTGDAGVDFYMNGGMTEFEDGSAGGSVTHNGGLIHRKTGAGTLRWGGQSTCTGIVQVVEGTLLLGASGALNPGTASAANLRAKQPVELLGGTLAAEANTTNAVQRLALTSGASVLALGDGAELSADAFDLFGDGATLAVTLGEGAVFRTATRLTPAQLRTIRVNDMRAFQDDDGSLYGMKTGVLLLVR